MKKSTVLAALTIIATLVFGMIRIDVAAAQLDSSARGDFVRNLSLSCVNTQRQNESTKKAGTQRIAEYCACYAANLSEAVSVDEARLALSGRPIESMPDSFIYKAADAAFACTGAERIEGAKSGCVDKIRQQNAGDKQAGMTEQEIDTYCTCYAANIVPLLSSDDINALRSGHPSASNADKIANVSATCMRTALVQREPVERRH